MHYQCVVQRLDEHLRYFDDYLGGNLRSNFGRHAIIMAASRLSSFPLFIISESDPSTASLMAAAAAGKHLDLPWESRAPPPSPIARAPESPETGGRELAVFLSRSHRVPDLVLPDRIFHRTAWKLPEIDLPSLISPDPDESALDLVKSAAASFGCFQISNHGIPDDLIAAAGSAAAAAFQISAEKKRKASRSPERDWGFESEDEKEEQNGFSEEFFWWRGRGEEELAGIWPQGFRDFSDKMERLWAEAEKITFKIEQILLGGEGIRGASDRSALYLHKHRRSSAGGDRPGGSLNHDVLRMLIRGSGSSHALGLHSCGGASRFHAYSKRGCVPFPLNKAALVLTVGDQIQVRSGGCYKHVIGKPIFHDGERDQAAISITFFHSNASSSQGGYPPTIGINGERTISLARQLMIASCLILLYHSIVYFCSKV